MHPPTKAESCAASFPVPSDGAPPPICSWSGWAIRERVRRNAPQRRCRDGRSAGHPSRRRPESRKGPARPACASVILGDSKVALAIPTTYMNESGLAVRSLATRFGIDDPASIVVVHDELDLPPGTVRVKSGGGLAGHNGLRSLQSHLHSDGLRPRAHRRRQAAQRPAGGGARPEPPAQGRPRRCSTAPSSGRPTRSSTSPATGSTPPCNGAIRSPDGHRRARR